MNFLEAQKTLIAILQTIGLLTYGLNRDGTVVDDNKFHIIYSVIAGVLYHGIIIVVHHQFIDASDNYLNDNNHLTSLVTFLEGLAIESCLIVFFYVTFVCREAQIRFLRSIVSLEREIKALRFTRLNYNQNLRRKSLAMIIITSFFHVAFIFCYSMVIPPDQFAVFLTETVCYTLFTCWLLLATHFMGNSVTTMGNLFDELSWNLQHSITSCPFHLQRGDVKKILMLHDRLIATIPDFNKTFGVIAFGIFASIFGIATCEVYFAFSATFTSVAPAEINILLNMLGNIISFQPLFITFCSFGFACGSVREKV